MPQELETALQIVLALAGAYLTALWFCLVVWTIRDIRTRTRDVIVQILATLLVLVFNIPGLVLYLILRPPETLDEQYERALEEEALLDEIRERQACPRCKTHAEPTFLVCPMCATPLKRRCPTCNQLLQLGWKLCPFCGVREPAREAEAASIATREA